MNPLDYKYFVRELPFLNMVLHLDILEKIINPSTQMNPYSSYNWELERFYIECYGMNCISNSRRFIVRQRW